MRHIYNKYENQTDKKKKKYCKHVSQHNNVKNKNSSKVSFMAGLNASRYCFKWTCSNL